MSYLLCLLNVLVQGPIIGKDDEQTAMLTMFDHDCSRYIGMPATELSQLVSKVIFIF